MVIIEEKSENIEDNNLQKDSNSDADEESDMNNENSSKKPYVIIIARTHPGDSNTSYVAQGK